MSKLAFEVKTFGNSKVISQIKPQDNYQGEKKCRRQTEIDFQFP